jgi:predicted DCC family thiol-disulfide oxidoreductase YuxK
MDRKFKLAQLRAKTDRELLILIGSTLDGLRSARTSEAERAYAEARALLPTVRDVTEAERRRLEAKLARLRGLLDERPVHAMARAQAACS